MPIVASRVWKRIQGPYGSFLATTAVVVLFMACAFDQILMGALCVLLLFAWCFYALVFWALLPPKRQIEFVCWDLRRMFVVVGCVAVIVGALANHWPLRLRFAVSLPELDQFADQLEGGLQMSKPTAVGLFVIKDAELRKGLPCLWTDPDPAGPVGFVRCKPEQAEFFNLFCNEQMNDRWQLIMED